MAIMWSPNISHYCNDDMEHKWVGYSWNNLDWHRSRVGDWCLIMGYMWYIEPLIIIGYYDMIYIYKWYIMMYIYIYWYCNMNNEQTWLDVTMKIVTILELYEIGLTPMSCGARNLKRCCRLLRVKRHDQICLYML